MAAYCLVSDGICVLGIAATVTRGALKVDRVLVRVVDEEVSVEELPPWQGTAADEARSLNDLVDALSNVLDRGRAGGADALAMKRVESPRGRPSTPYDQKTRAEGAAMIAAAAQGRPYYSYRTNQVDRGATFRSAAQRSSGYPSTDTGRDAVAAACAALADLRDER